MIFVFSWNTGLVTELGSPHPPPNPHLVAEPEKVLVGELNEWVADPLGPGQTSALQIKARSA